jgi:hypothetical protein
MPCACHLKNAVRLSASLTVPTLFKVHTVHVGTLVSGCVSRTVMFRSGSKGRRRRLSNVADPCARRIAVGAGFCLVGEMFTVRYELYYSYELLALEGFINAGLLIPVQ